MKSKNFIFVFVFVYKMDKITIGQLREFLSKNYEMNYDNEIHPFFFEILVKGKNHFNDFLQFMEE